MKSESISVIIPFYNSIDTIERAINSVLTQSLRPKEIIVVDDQSSEAEFDFISELVKTTNNKTKINVFLFVMELNGGAGEARNLGWSNASGDFVAFLDADDMWLPNKLEVQHSFFENDHELTLCGHKYMVVKDKSLLGNILHAYKDKKNLVNGSKVITKKNQLLRNRFATSTVMIRNDINNRFEKNKRYSEDFLLWSEIISSGNKAIKVDESLAIYFKSIFGESGLSSNIYKMFIGNLKSYQVLYKKGFINLFYLFLYTFISYIRFIRRIFIVFFRKI